jgi:hypothetical protein
MQTATSIMQKRVSLRIEKRYALRILLLLTLSLHLACAQREVGVRALSANTTTPQAQISAAVKGDDIEVKVTLVNCGSSPFALLKWNLPADGRLDAGMFEVSRDGKKVDYRGMEIKRAVSDADYVLLEPGRKYTTTIRLAQGYDIHPKGKYTIQYRTWNPVPDGSKVLSFESNVVEVDKQ